MSDDEFNEDEEYEPKKRRPPVKSILKAIITISVGVLGIFLVNRFWTNTFGLTSGFFLLCLASTLLSQREKPKEKVKHTYSLYQCNNDACGIKELHNFKDGDFVFKKIGPCWKCKSGWMFIHQIFAIEIKAKDRIRLSSPERPTLNDLR
ncbi:MAG: hypothetical protein ACTSWN_03385 [Promethearchaeota archaeon]